MTRWNAKSRQRRHGQLYVVRTRLYCVEPQRLPGRGDGCGFSFVKERRLRRMGENDGPASLKPFN